MFSLHLIDVGQGEAILLDLPDGSFGLLDGGPDPGASAVLPLVADRVAAGRTFRFAGATHWDRDHIGGLPLIIETYRPEYFLSAALDLDLLEKLHAELRDVTEPLPSQRLAAATRGIRRWKRWARESVPLGEAVTMYVLGPNETVEDDLRDAIAARQPLRKFRNRASLVLWLEVYGRRFLLPGEVTPDQCEEAWRVFRLREGGLGGPDHRAAWLKLSHHGSKRNNTMALFRRWAAKRFVASASSGGKYGHPHPQVLRVLSADCGGTPMCTGLGHGCWKIGHEKLDPRARHAWEQRSHSSWGDWPKRGSSCYGTVTVSVSPDGGCSVSGGSIQSSCPFGGPSGGRVAIR